MESTWGEMLRRSLVESLEAMEEGMRLAAGSAPRQMYSPNYRLAAAEEHQRRQ